ncbi:hypothetical protein SODALDRAFT_279783 [Sodiomyces alkalinus F11]|uniref:Cellular morphogenesis protein n=1 Tax=Sodiomyces alkalinus (strain CBS 110278 / VKM F-3762 / F11) TaxID=1314773 RepID=A0A3N2PS03_SODAK|nr:hypothetical protein SODALDRAFT_279783 [Sodiomyces alkalinus F11]ROT37268.1 hypothetical protein SODALDRAFT_279783 [Sodiomyces alkalinus F11]
MRLPFRRRSAAPRDYSRARPKLLAIAALAASSLVSANDFTAIPEVDLDLSRLGRIGLAGDFTGISFYEFEGQSERPVRRNGSESLLAVLPNGAFASIASTDASIHDMCVSTFESGDVAGVVIAGNFTSVDGTPSQGVVMYNTTSDEFVPLDGLSGQVNALLCDSDSNRVYVGGSFRHANSTNAMSWVHGEGWTPLPFAGFNGPVSSITKASNGHIIFGGRFTGLGNTTTPDSPDGQAINLVSANITSGSSSTRGGFSDPRNILCKTDGQDGPGDTWLLQDNSPGFWQASFGFGFRPSKVRLHNTHLNGRGTRTWRFTALPINGILNMTYVDPTTGRNVSCTSECPLSDSPDVVFQDFHFVNTVGMNAFRIDISDFYGEGAGLNGIQVFTDDISTYAIDDFNEPTCSGLSISNPSTATATGPWTQSPSLESNSGYLTARLSGDISEDSASVVFFPNIQQSGNYSVEMYTPGCIQDGTCATRAQVNVTGDMSLSPDGRFTTSLYQTNNFDKYDQIYFGFIEASTEGFRPSITLTPLGGQSLENMTIVAQRVGFSLVNSTGGLNGLFDYDPTVDTVDRNNFSSSAIHRLGAGFSAGSAVTSLETMGDLVVVGGNFSSNGARNVIAIDTTDQSPQTLSGGLNGEVRSMHLEGSRLFVGGGFSNTLDGQASGLSRVAVYDREDGTWSALGAGVDGNVWHVVPMRMNITDDEPETVIAITGDFDQINDFGDNAAVPVSGFAIWVPSQRNWLQNLDGTAPVYSGVLTASLLDIPDSGPLFAGSMSSASIGANGAVTLTEDGNALGQFPIKIQPSTTRSSTVARRDILSEGDVNGVVTGAFYEEDDHDVTILAGHFTAEDGNGSPVHNLVFINGSAENAVRGVGDGISENSTFVALAIVDDILFAGGDVAGTVNDGPVRGLLTFDLASGTLNSQPPAIDGGNATVSAIQVRPDSGEVYVGGAFESAGSLDCPGVCYYNTELLQWNRPGFGLRGSVSALLWTSDSLLVAGGDMTINGSSASLAQYTADDQTWSPFAGQDDLPGPVEVITRGSRNGDQLWVSGRAANGSVYVMKHDGSDWHVAGQTLSLDTVIRGLQVLTVTSSHDDTDVLSSNQVLMLTGSIGIPDFGTSSAALFDGTTFRPYILTTNSGNNAGTISQLFSQHQDFFTNRGINMALVFVVLIGLAIALGLMFLLVVAGVVLDRLRKKREGYVPAPTSMYDRGSGISRIPPAELFQSLGKREPGAPRI